MRLNARDLDLLVTVYKHINAEGARPDLAAALLRLVSRLSRQNEGEYPTCLSLSREQIQRDIPYQVVCETRYGARWDTGTRKRRWDSEFSHALKSGAPASVKMTGAAYDLWQKLGDFCASL